MALPESWEPLPDQSELLEDRMHKEQHTFTKTDFTAFM